MTDQRDSVEGDPIIERCALAAAVEERGAILRDLDIQRAANREMHARMQALEAQVAHYDERLAAALALVAERAERCDVLERERDEARERAEFLGVRLVERTEERDEALAALSSGLAHARIRCERAEAERDEARDLGKAAYADARRATVERDAAIARAEKAEAKLDSSENALLVVQRHVGGLLDAVRGAEAQRDEAEALLVRLLDGCEREHGDAWDRHIDSVCGDARALLEKRGEL